MDVKNYRFRLSIFRLWQRGSSGGHPGAGLGGAHWYEKCMTSNNAKLVVVNFMFVRYQMMT